MLFANTAIDNSLNAPDLLAAVTPFGYDAARLNAGKAIVSDLEALHNQKEIKYSNKYAQTGEKNSAREAAYDKYIVHVKLARVAIKDNPVFERQLGLQGKRATDLNGFLLQATRFYNIALDNADIQTTLATVGIDTTQLQDGLSAVTAIQAAHTEQINAKGEAEAATKIRDQKADEVIDWLSDYIKIARIALEDSPQALERIGVYVKS